MYNYKGYILFIFIYSLGVFLLCKPLQASNFMFCYAFVCEINKKIIFESTKGYIYINEWRKKCGTHCFSCSVVSYFEKQQLMENIRLLGTRKSKANQ